MDRSFRRLKSAALSNDLTPKIEQSVKQKLNNKTGRTIMLSPDYDHVPVEVGLTVLKPHRLFGLRPGAQIFYAEKPHYRRGEVVVVEVTATQELAICANFSVQDSDLIMLLVPVFES